MATIRQTILTCDRCAFGKEKPATEKRIFSIENRFYQLDLCSPHADAHDRDFGVWTRLARDIDNPYDGKRSVIFTREKNEETRRVLDQSDDVKRVREQSLFAQREAERLAMVAEKEAFRQIPGAMKWTMTRHARERMMERNFTPAEVLMTVTMPATRQPSVADPTETICRRGDCHVIVNPRTHTIITVMDRNAATKQSETTPTAVAN